MTLRPATYRQRGGTTFTTKAPARAVSCSICLFSLVLLKGEAK